MSNYFSFFTKSNNAKPVTIKQMDDAKPPCPFCNYEVLSKKQEILKDMDESLLVSNLYPTIRDTVQTVFIETKSCDANFLNYEKETAIQVMRNYFDSYIFLSEKYPDQQIVGFKNSGEYSSGSIHHQHMQLLVLDKFLQEKDNLIFEGSPAFEESSITVNFSEKPSTEFYEINLSISNEDLFAYGKIFEKFCVVLQECIQFALSSITKTNSYNLAFYFKENEVIIKLLPRLVNHSVAHTPLFLAFDMHLVPDNLDEVRHQLREKLKKIQ